MKRNGFSVVELIIVLAIVALLIAIAIPQFMRLQSGGKLVCDDGKDTWLRECAKYSSVVDCKHKAESLFCHRENN